MLAHLHMVVDRAGRLSDRKYSRRLCALETLDISCNSSMTKSGFTFNSFKTCNGKQLVAWTYSCGVSLTKAALMLPNDVGILTSHRQRLMFNCKKIQRLQFHPWQIWRTYSVLLIDLIKSSTFMSLDRSSSPRPRTLKIDSFHFDERSGAD